MLDSFFQGKSPQGWRHLFLWGGLFFWRKREGLRIEFWEKSGTNSKTGVYRKQTEGKTAQICVWRDSDIEEMPIEEEKKGEATKVRGTEKGHLGFTGQGPGPRPDEKRKKKKKKKKKRGARAKAGAPARLGEGPGPGEKNSYNISYVGKCAAERLFSAPPGFRVRGGRRKREGPGGGGRRVPEKVIPGVVPGEKKARLLCVQFASRSKKKEEGG